MSQLSQWSRDNAAHLLGLKEARRGHPKESPRPDARGRQQVVHQRSPWPCPTGRQASPCVFSTVKISSTLLLTADPISARCRRNFQNCECIHVSSLCGTAQSCDLNGCNDGCNDGMAVTTGRLQRRQRRQRRQRLQRLQQRQRRLRLPIRPGPLPRQRLQRRRRPQLPPRPGPLSRQRLQRRFRPLPTRPGPPTLACLNPAQGRAARPSAATPAAADAP